MFKTYAAFQSHLSLTADENWKCKIGGGVGGGGGGLNQQAVTCMSTGSKMKSVYTYLRFEIEDGWKLTPLYLYDKLFNESYKYYKYTVLGGYFNR